jgi:hypothetical protein
MIRSKAEHKYRDIRLAIFERIISELTTQGLASGSIRLADITDDAIAEHHSWPTQPVGREIGWSWESERNRFRKHYARRLEVAIWHNSHLCGLMLGKVSKGKLVVTINYMHGAVDDSHPLRGRLGEIFIRCAELFAIAIDAQWLAIDQPIPALIEHYKSFGFVAPSPFNAKSSAIFRRLR